MEFILLPHVTFLSDGVKNVLCFYMSENDTLIDCLNENKTINWNAITPSLNLSENDKDCVLRRCILHVKAVYSSLTEEEIQQLLQCIAWTSMKKIYLHCHGLLCDDSNRCNAILALLLITSYLERILGNVFLLKGQRVPHLLKDLLATDELKSIIGEKTIGILELVMGSPKTLNLRNLLWHGFVNPDELDNRFGFFLLAWLASIQDACHLHEINIPIRKQIQFTWLSNVFSVLPKMVPLWIYSLNLFLQDRFGESLVLMLPQLENCLRCIFVFFNDCHERLLTAEATSFYTTFDEMLVQYLPDGQPNKMHTALGDNFMEMYLDVLVYSDGPRVRDKVSHGEIDLDDIPRELVVHLIRVAAATSALALPANSSLLQDEYVQQLKTFSSTYRSHFHPSILLRQQILSMASSLKEWKFCLRPSLESFPSIEVTEPTFTSVLQLKCVVGVSPISEYDCHERLLTKVEEFRSLTTFRPKSEAEVVTVLLQIARHGCRCAFQVAEALRSRYTRWLQKSLKSRQRLNYGRLLCSTDCIMLGLQCVVQVLSIYFLNLNDLSSLDEFVFKKMIRFQKRVLQYVENMDSLTDATNNRWKESCTLTEEFVQLLKDLSMTD